MIKIIALDGHTLNPGDLSWEGINSMADFEVYPRTEPEEIIERAKFADILIVNKCILNRPILENLPNLKYICVSATGYNNVDLEYCNENKIPVSNVVGYSTSSVAQHVFALLMALNHQVEKYSSEVHNGVWSRQEDFSYWNQPIMEFQGKTMGIYGFGKIGQAVAKLALAFGMKVMAFHKYPDRDVMEHVQMVDVDTLFSESDVLTLHAPLNSMSQNIISAVNLKKMKPTSFLINTGRGGLVNENDLKIALENNQIAGAGLDVLSSEPPSEDHILLGAKNCIITPHQAWASLSSRKRLMEEVRKNIEGYLKGKIRNEIKKFG